MKLLDMTTSNELIEEGIKQNMEINDSIEYMKRKQVNLLIDIAEDTCRILIAACKDKNITRESVQNIIRAEFSMLKSEIARIK